MLHDKVQGESSFSNLEEQRADIETIFKSYYSFIERYIENATAQYNTIYNFLKFNI